MRPRYDENRRTVRRWARQRQRIALLLGRSNPTSVHFRLKPRTMAGADGDERVWVDLLHPEELPKELREEAESQLGLDHIPYPGTRVSQLASLLGQKRLEQTA